jgi:translocator protein
VYSSDYQLDGKTPLYILVLPPIMITAQFRSSYSLTGQAHPPLQRHLLARAPICKQIRAATQMSLGSLAVSVGVPLALGQVMGLWSAPDILNGWYQKLRKPKITPPIWLFGPTWGLLYTLMGVAAWKVWRAGAGRVTLGLYAAQLALNLAWQPLFFKKHDLKLAEWDISVLLVLLGVTVYKFNQFDPTAALLMVPYVAFSTFAALLTHRFRVLNGDKVE